MEQNDFDIKKVKVYRTKEGTFFEIVVAVLLIIAWAVAFHFEWTTPVEFIGVHIHTIILTIVPIIMMVIAYYPNHMYSNSKYKYSFPKNSKGFSNIRQVEITIRLLRILGVEFALFVLLLNLMSVKMIDSQIVIGSFSILPLITVIIFSILKYRAR